MSDSAAPPAPLGTILAATDLSPSAAVGVRWAAALAADHRCRLHLVHALSLTPWTLEYSSLKADIQDRLRADAERRLGVLATETARSGIEVDWSVDTGEPSRAVLRAACRIPAGLVVIGSRGRRGIDSLILGSTARRVVQRSPVPVLTVHPGDADRVGPVRRILAATDFSEESLAAARAALTLLPPAAGEESRVFLLHAFHVPYELDAEAAFGSAASGLRLRQDVETDSSRRLERCAAELAARGIAVETLAVEGDPPGVIAERAEEIDVDLIAMGTHGRTGLVHFLLGSTAERVVHRAIRPVLTIRRGGQRPTAGPS